jgi:predicted lipid-binding transport protein (Tim44 family)
MPFIDIIIILGVIVFAASRFLAHKMPTDTRPKGSAKNDLQNLMRKPIGEVSAPQAPAKKVLTAPESLASKAERAKNLNGLDKIKALDETFDEAEFINGVKGAYHYFYDRLNAADETGLDNLCGPALLAELTTRLQSLAKHGKQLKINIEKIIGAEITSARVNGRTAIIEVALEAYQAEAEITVGSKNTMPPSAPEKNLWVLARALGSDDPNWEVQSIKPLGGKA